MKMTMRTKLNSNNLQVSYRNLFIAILDAQKPPLGVGKERE
jgi:hypothetical protein